MSRPGGSVSVLGIFQDTQNGLLSRGLGGFYSNMKATILVFVLGCALGLVSVPLTTVHPHESEWLPLQINRVQENPLANARGSVTPRSYHLANLTIGFPPKTYEMELDLTMSGCWITSESCESMGCYPKTGYNSSESMMHKPKGDTVRIEYGGGKGTGKLSSDTVSIGGLHVISFTFSELETLSGGKMIRAPYDGVLGALWSGSATNPENLFSALYSRRLIESNSFSVSLSETKGDQMVLGGVDASLALFSLSYYPLLDIAPWTIMVKSILIAHQPLSLAFPTLKIDLTTPYFLGSFSLIDQINTAIGHIPANCTDIAQFPNIILDMNINEYVITPEMYVIRTETDSGERCFSGFVGKNMEEGLQETLVVGDAFVRKHYTHFDMQNKQVGFAFSA